MAASLNGPRRLEGKPARFLPQRRGGSRGQLRRQERAPALGFADLLAVRHLTQVRRVIALYTLRWCVEEYHKALKSGAGVEDSQMDAGPIGSNRWWQYWRIVAGGCSIPMAGADAPDEPVNAKSFGPSCLTLLAAKFGNPKGAGVTARRWFRWPE